MKNKILKTSADWLAESEYKGYVIMDPDGWDRTNYDYSFNVEEISKTEFEKRLNRSTIMIEKLSNSSAPGQTPG